MRSLKGSKALVTGAAAGIGRAIMLALAREGCAVWGVDRDGEALAEAIEAAAALGVEVGSSVCDLGDSAAIETLTRDVIRDWPGLNLLVNNAGLTYYGPTHAMSDEQWQRILDVNLHAPIRLIRRLLPCLRGAEAAHVVNVCSMYGLVSYRKQAAYQATKFGLVGLTQSLRYEYAGTGLGFSAVCPGYVRDTRFFGSVMTPPDRRAKTPPRAVTCAPESVARAVVKAVRRDRGVVVLTPLARWQWAMTRWFPRGFDALQRWGYGHSARRKRRQARATTE